MSTCRSLIIGSMNRGMQRLRTYFDALVAALAALALLCSCEKGLSTDSSSETGLFLRVSVDDYSSFSSTKADTERAWTSDTWNESTISSLYMFIFTPSTSSEDDDSSESYTLKHACYWKDQSSYSDLQLKYTNDDTETDCPYYLIDDDDLVYLIANYDLSSTYSSMTYSSLLALTDKIGTSTTPYGSTSDDGTAESSEDDTSDDSSSDDSSDDSSSETTYLTCRGPQSSLVMSAVVKGSEITKTDQTDSYGNVTKRTISVVLQRRMAKLCVRIKYKGLTESSYSQLTSFSDKCIYLKCMNFAEEGAVTSDGTSVTTAYYDTEEDGSYSSTLTTSGSLKSDGDFYTTGETLYDPDNTSDNRAVFYLYPNCWYDNSKASKMMTTTPIISSRQTCLSMKIIFAKGTAREADFPYTIPTNYPLPENNDSQTLSADDYINLYSIQSNHVYNVTVYVQELETGFSVSVSSIADLSSGGTQTL